VVVGAGTLTFMLVGEVAMVLLVNAGLVAHSTWSPPEPALTLLNVKLCKELEQMDCAVGAAGAVGTGLTVTATVLAVLLHPLAVADTV
jgi:hypothetical protein